MKRYPAELKNKVVAALYELDNSEPAKAGAIAKIAKDHGINANVVYHCSSIHLSHHPATDSWAVGVWS